MLDVYIWIWDECVQYEKKKFLLHGLFFLHGLFLFLYMVVVVTMVRTVFKITYFLILFNILTLYCFE